MRAALRRFGEFDIGPYVDREPRLRQRCGTVRRCDWLLRSRRNQILSQRGEAACELDRGAHAIRSCFSRHS